MDLLPLTPVEERFWLPAARFLAPADRGRSVIALESALTEREAINAFRSRDTRWVRRVRQIRLRSTAQVFVPYYVFHVIIADGKRRQPGLFAVDAVRGVLDPYHFEAGLDTLGLEPIHSPNCLPAALEIDAAWPILADRLRRVIFQTGFWRTRQAHLSTEGDPLTVHLPYWIGFYAAGRFVRLEVLDGVRRCFEGAKARALFESWLVESQPRSRD